MTAFLRFAIIGAFASAGCLFSTDSRAQSAGAPPSAEARTKLLRCAKGLITDSKLRVTFRESSQTRWTGRFAGLSGDSTLLLAMAGRAGPAPISVSRVALVEEPDGVDRHTFVGALVGFGLGALLAGSEQGGDSFEDLSDWSVPVYTLSGLLLGAGVGYLITSERWAARCNFDPGSERGGQGR